MFEIVEKHLLISGRVQGVGYRHFTKTEADALGIPGWVRNRPDGRVEAVLKGPPDRVDRLILRLRAGPALGRVLRIEITDRRSGESFDSFEIRH